MRVTDYFNGIDRVKTADNAESWLLGYGNKKLLAIRYQNMMAGVNSPKYDGMPKGRSNNNAVEDKMTEIIDKHHQVKEYMRITEQVVESIENDDMRTILIRKYLEEGNSDSNIMDEIHRGKSAYYDMRRDALNVFAFIFPPFIKQMIVQKS
ncbi:MAG: DUF1492 domain-containing protein [Liquorilactobacillus nagelii]|jgi:ArpU family phage transcriptional regulator|uniref:ArpU family phage packaging/lysis transcriptional regulator n=1 Tax=Liquorilactobacillus nagelii TaxID=82688 RepID=UPI002431D740|nr:ArpU family phage packaging/lysis transcriptional regulator [Liquorilactobacillus nagelii]MCI1978057.1 DUF1492 domain-containing protein [Liquorilactobacillus nagelii]